MQWNVRCKVLGFTLITLISLSARAQETPSPGRVHCPASGRCGNDGCISKPVFLQQCRHIELTKTGLIAALQDPDPATRDAAADTLTSGTTDATKEEVVSALVGTLKREKQIRFTIALDLANLGDPEGLAALRGICDDAGLLTFQRISAGQALANAGDNHCLNVVMAVAQSGSNEDRAVALTSLPDYKQVAAQQARAIFNLLTQALTDKAPHIRYLASLQLVRWGDSAAVPYFEKAIALEQDEQTKNQFETDLRRLQGQKP